MYFQLALISLYSRFHYEDGFRPDLEVKRGLWQCIEKMFPDEDMRTKIDKQLDMFKHKRGMFGSNQALLMRKSKQPGKQIVLILFKHKRVKGNVLILVNNIVLNFNYF